MSTSKSRETVLRKTSPTSQYVTPYGDDNANSSSYFPFCDYLSFSKYTTSADLTVLLRAKSFRLTCRGQLGDDSMPVAPTRPRRAGFAKGIITYIAPDFDAPLKDMMLYQREPRLTGPIQFLVSLLKTWGLNRTDAIPLLGMEEADWSYVSDLLSGHAVLRGRDLKYRIAYLFRIRKTLSALFRDEKVENDWLRERHDALDGRTPIDCMLEGSMENLLLVKEYVEAAAGL